MIMLLWAIYHFHYDSVSFKQLLDCSDMALGTEQNSNNCGDILEFKPTIYNKFSSV